jgi:hypothetical protein
MIDGKPIEQGEIFWTRGDASHPPEQYYVCGALRPPPGVELKAVYTVYACPVGGGDVLSFTADGRLCSVSNKSYCDLVRRVVPRPDFRIVVSEATYEGHYRRVLDIFEGDAQVASIAFTKEWRNARNSYYSNQSGGPSPKFAGYTDWRELGTLTWEDAK